MRISIFALALTCACNYAVEQAGLFVEVDNIPPQADHLDATVTA